MRWQDPIGTSVIVCLLASGVQAQQRSAAVLAPSSLVAPTEEVPEREAGALVLGGASRGGFGEEEDDPYFDTTPICHYLERGVDDQAAAKRDGFVMTVPGLNTLADLDHVAFGLDLPGTRCADNPHGTPCADDDDPRDWCISRVELSVLGMKIFDQSADAGDDCLMTATGGADEAGIRTISRFDLRNNPEWGFTAEQLSSLIPYLSASGGGFDFLPPRIVYGAEFLSRQIEGLIGHFLALDAMGCANGTYCSHRRNEPRKAGGVPVIPTLVWSDSSDVDCDFGGCPSTSSRQASPWLETRGAGPAGDRRLEVDADVSFLSGTYDPGDCVRSNPGAVVEDDCGTLYTNVGQGSVRFDLRVPCVEYAHVSPIPEDVVWQPADDFVEPGQPVPPPAQAPAAPVHRLRHCDDLPDDDVTTDCLALDGDAFLDTRGELNCPGGADDEAWEALCGEQVELTDTTYDIRVTVHDPHFESEGGLLPWVLDYLLCGFVLQLGPSPLCSADALLTDGLRDSLDTSMFEKTLYRRLDGCPGIAIDDAGQLAIQMQPLDSCPPGTHDPDCFGPGEPGYTTGDGTSEDGAEAGWVMDFAAAVAPTRTPTRTLSPEPTPLTTKTTALAPSTRLVSAGTGALAPSATFVAPDVAASGKLSMDELDLALVRLCALAESCAPGTPLQALPLQQMALLDPDAISSIGTPPNPPTEEWVDDAMDTVGFLLGNATFRSDCLAFNDPGFDPQTEPGEFFDDLTLLAALGAWYAEAFEPALEDDEPGSCQATTPSFESIFPAMGLMLHVTTGGGNVRDGFAFVNFSGEALSDDLRSQGYGCFHRKSQGLPTADGPTCGADGVIAHGPDAGDHECGRVALGPCADMNHAIQPGDLALGDPNEPRLHPNGTYSWHHYCLPDVHTGRDMVCVPEYFIGAGQNVFPTCKICGTPEPGDDPSAYTMLGCPLEDGPECPDGLLLGMDGRCWEAAAGPPSWTCAADCESLYGEDLGYCMHGYEWLSFMAATVPEAGLIFDDVGGLDYTQPICADWSCPEYGLRCGWHGEACENGDACVDECWSDAECQSVDPPPAYPQGFVCSPDQTCVPGG